MRAVVGQRSVPLPERIVELFLLACGMLSIFITAAIVYILLSESISFFSEVSLAEFFGDTRWTPRFIDKHYGVWPLVSGTFLIAGIAMMIAAPFGILSAIYLSEFARPGVRKTIKPALELLAGIPTIVYGFFALAFVTPFLKTFIPDLTTFNALSPGIVMGIMIIPMVSSLTEDALYAVPSRLREGAYALGARKLPTIFGVVLPAASSGIIASLTLAFSRAIGETMIVAVAAGALPRFSSDPTEPTQTMTGYIVGTYKGEVVHGSLDYKTIFAVGMMLFVLTFIVNYTSRRIDKIIGGVQFMAYRLVSLFKRQNQEAA